MSKIIKFLKKNSFPISLIVLGSLILFWIKDYRKVPSGIGPDFFPRIIATLLIGLSTICIFVEWKKDNVGEVVPDKEALIKILISAILFVGCTLIMRYVHVLIGVFLFLVGYIKAVSEEKWARTLLISVFGTGIIYLILIILRVRM